MTVLRPFWLAIAACLVASSAMAQLPPPYEAIRTPTTMVELLRNVQIVAEQQFLLRDDFYATEVVARVLAVPRRSHLDPDDLRFEGPIQIDDARCYFEVGNEKSNLILRGPFRRLIVRCPSGSMFEQIEQVLGKDWENQLRPPPSDGGRNLEPFKNVPHSYAYISYRTATGPMVIDFDAGGRFSQLHLFVLPVVGR
jgi:hypothetical protein